MGLIGGFIPESRSQEKQSASAVIDQRTGESVDFEQTQTEKVAYSLSCSDGYPASSIVTADFILTQINITSSAIAGSSSFSGNLYVYIDGTLIKHLYMGETIGSNPVYWSFNIDIPNWFINKDSVLSINIPAEVNSTGRAEVSYIGFLA